MSIFIWWKTSSWQSTQICFHQSLQKSLIYICKVRSGSLIKNAGRRQRPYWVRFPDGEGLTVFGVFIHTLLLCSDLTWFLLSALFELQNSHAILFDRTCFCADICLTTQLKDVPDIRKPLGKLVVSPQIISCIQRYFVKLIQVFIFSRTH